MLETWQFWALLSALFAALTAVLGKIGVERVDPTFATFLRTIVVLCFAGAFVVLTRAQQPLGEISQKAYLFLTLSGMATGASWLCYYHALKLGPASQVAPIDKLSVVFVAVLGAIVLREHLSAKHWLGVAMISTGAILLAANP